MLLKTQIDSPTNEWELSRRNKNHATDVIIENSNEGVRTKYSHRNQSSLISYIDPKSIKRLKLGLKYARRAWPV